MLQDELRRVMPQAMLDSDAAAADVSLLRCFMRHADTPHY